jgi:uncharacterized membrane protein YcaP (DUF421 family)
MNTFQSLLGLEAKELTFNQVIVRGIVVFFATLLIARIADKRFFAKKTAFDVILGLILASMLARAINGTEPLFATIATGFVLAGLHRLLARIAFYSPVFGKWIKGTSDVLVQDGEPLRQNMKRNDISDDDLREELRLEGQVREPREVKLATLERSGEISVIGKE